MWLEFTRKAEVDIEEIEDFSVATFGVLVGHEYISGLVEACKALAETPHMGSAFRIMADLIESSKKADTLLFIGQNQRRSQSSGFCILPN